MLSTVTSKGQITIPKNIRTLLNIRANDKIDFVIQGNQAVLVPVRTLCELRGAVTATGIGDFAKERSIAKKAVSKRIHEEMS
jgi:AbrB family looped-hinge helix DNA binding protein